MIRDWKVKESDYKFRQTSADEHPYHKDGNFFKSCRVCVNEKLLKESKVIPCPDCGLYTMKSRLYKSVRCYDTEFYCTDCGEYWRRVKDEVVY